LPIPVIGLKARYLRIGLVAFPYICGGGTEPDATTGCIAGLKL